jgi:hypothetical protein
MHNDEDVASARIPFSTVVVLLLGSRLGQAGWLIIGISVLGVVFRHHPDKGFSTGSIPLITCIGIALICFGIVKGFGYAKLLRTGRLFTGRVLKIEEINSDDSTIYRLTVEYHDDLGKAQLFSRDRAQNDLAVGQSLNLIVNPQSGEGVLEQDIPGGLSISGVYEFRPASFFALFRVVAIPVSAFTPLISFLPSVLSVEPGLSTVISNPFVYTLSPIFSTVWLFLNARFFPYTRLAG